MGKSKPMALKPMFYSVILEPMKKIALEFGYNLVIHGSLNRDMDVILIPWVDNCNESDDLVESLAKFLGGSIHMHGTVDNQTLGRILPGGAGRKTYIINLNRGGKYNYWDDKEYYIDISVTPKVINKD